MGFTQQTQVKEKPKIPKTPDALKSTTHDKKIHLINNYPHDVDVKWKDPNNVKYLFVNTVTLFIVMIECLRIRTDCQYPKRNRKSY